jgi:hypothetical protein
MNLKLIL